jgi:hypothetical protein
MSAHRRHFGLSTRLHNSKYRPYVTPFYRITMFHSHKTIAAYAFAAQCYIVTAPFLSKGVTNKMKKADIQEQLKIRGMKTTGTVRELRAELEKRVRMEKQGSAERPTVNAFAWTCKEIRYFLKQAGCTHFRYIKDEMLELLILTIEDAKLARRRQEEELNNLHRDKRKRDAKVEEKEEVVEPSAKRRRVSISAVKVVCTVTKPVTFMAKAVCSGGKSVTKLVQKGTRCAQDRVRGYQAYRNSGGRQAYNARVAARAKKIQKVHSNYGKKTILGFRSFCGIAFGPKGVSKAKATRMAREFENARLRRPPTDPVIKGCFGSLNDIERRIKEAEFNTRHVNSNKTRPIVNPYAPRKTYRSRVQVKFNLA